MARPAARCTVQTPDPVRTDGDELGASLIWTHAKPAMLAVFARTSLMPVASCRQNNEADRSGAAGWWAFSDRDIFDIQHRSRGFFKHANRVASAPR